jgi:hypothetical protein
MRRMNVEAETKTRKMLSRGHITCMGCRPLRSGTMSGCQRMR